MSVFYAKTAKIRWRLKLRPTLKKCFKFKAYFKNAYEPVTNFARGRSPVVTDH